MRQSSSRPGGQHIPAAFPREIRGIRGTDPGGRRDGSGRTDAAGKPADRYRLAGRRYDQRRRPDRLSGPDAARPR
ncbi:MAG: hypothetical protein EBU57_05280, partial [Alphaproteobacteria bacterium]|nr:hypothetical protein [Alphaproteobacteria bacterium]